MEEKKITEENLTSRKDNYDGIFENSEDVPKNKLISKRKLKGLEKIFPGCLDTVLGLPRTKSDFEVLKKTMERIEERLKHIKKIDHPEFPIYSKELDIKWAELLKIEEKRKMRAYLKEDEDLKGLIVFYINVAYLAPNDAENYISNFKKKCQSVTNKIPLDYGIIWVPVKGNEETHVQLVEFNKGK